MGPLGVVEGDLIFDDPPGLEAVVDLLEIDCLLLQASPKSFNEDVVEVSALTVDRDAHACLCQRRDSGGPDELRPLIFIHDFRWAVFSDGWVQGIDAKVGMHSVR